MRKIYYILFSVMVLCVACDFKWRPYDNGDDTSCIKVRRYDRLESRYLTTGDFSALQQMNTDYPLETRTLVEKVLKLGEVSEANISNKFLMFYQDSTLQVLLSDVESAYANMDDINRQFQGAFARLGEWIPGLEIPQLYTQIGALDQSIIVGEKVIGISLDKYMGESYPLYKKYYPASQLSTMNRTFIVPDALCFYLLSLYPMKNFEHCPQIERDLHVGKVMWVVNKALGKHMFHSQYVAKVERFMRLHRYISIKELLESDNYTAMK